MKNPIQILLVEDEVLSAMFMEKELKKSGYQVCCHVTTGENAINCAKLHNPDLILMDIHLTGEMDGIQAAHEIAKFSPTPVLFITGYDDQETMDRAKQVNALSYIIKPVDMKEIDSIIHSHFS